MSNTARKARKKSGEKFTHKEKVGTPLELRALRGKHLEHQDMMGLSPSRVSNRHRRKIQDQIAIRDRMVIPTQKELDEWQLHEENSSERV